MYGFALALGRLAVGLFVALPAVGLTYAYTVIEELNAGSATAWLADPTMNVASVLLGLTLLLLIVPLTLVFQVIAMRAAWGACSRA